MTSHPRLSIIPGWCAMDPRLKGKDLQVLCVLGRNTSTKSGWTRRSQVAMAGELGCARSTVQASLDRLIEIGAIERHVVESSNGRDSAHWYRIIYDREPPGGYDFDAWQGGDEEENILSCEAGDDAPPAGIPAPPAGPESAPPAGPGPAPINVSCLTPAAERMEREGAPARDNLDDGGDDHSEEQAENPKAVEKAFREWFFVYPTAKTDDEGNARREWWRLSPEERERATRRLPGWIAAVKASGRTKWPAAASYLSARKFDLIDDQEARAALRKTKRVALKPFGPVWGGMRALALAKGPKPVELPGNLREAIETSFAVLRRTSEAKALAYLERKGIMLNGDGALVFPDDFERDEYLRRQRDEGFPAVERLHKLARAARSELVDGINAALAELCEAVQVGSETYEAWRTYHLAMNWPPWPDPGQMKVVYFPKGGPDGWPAFVAAARAAMSDGGRGDADAA